MLQQENLIRARVKSRTKTLANHSNAAIFTPEIGETAKGRLLGSASRWDLPGVLHLLYISWPAERGDRWLRKVIESRAFCCTMLCAMPPMLSVAFDSG